MTLQAAATIELRCARHCGHKVWSRPGGAATAAATAAGCQPARRSVEPQCSSTLSGTAAGPMHHLCLSSTPRLVRLPRESF